MSIFGSGAARGIALAFLRAVIIDPLLRESARDGRGVLDGLFEGVLCDQVHMALRHFVNIKINNKS